MHDTIMGILVSCRFDPTTKIILQTSTGSSPLRLNLYVNLCSYALYMCMSIYVRMLKDPAHTHMYVRQRIKNISQFTFKSCHHLHVCIERILN